MTSLILKSIGINQVHENCHPADRALLNIPLSLLNSSSVHFILYAFKLAFSYKLEHVLVTTTKYLILPNFIVFFNLLNIQLIPYSCRVGIKTSRCIHKKTEWHQASLLNLVFPLHRVQYKKQGELRPPPMPEDSRESCLPAIKYKSNNKYIHSNEKSISYRILLY